MENGGNRSLILGDCYPMDSRSFEQFKLSGDKIEEHGDRPSTVHMFVKMDRQQSRLYAAAYGQEHLNERHNDVARLNDIHDECPDFFTAAFLSETWRRMVYQYDACIAEGIQFVL